MKLFIAIVNHNHDELICSNDDLTAVARLHQVAIKSNTQASSLLIEFCHHHNIELIQDNKSKGFGENNNDIYRFFEPKINLEEDYFLVLNPDVFVDQEELDNLLMLAKHHQSDVSAINLFTDRDKKIFDRSIRHFPKISNPIKTLLKIKRNDFYDKSTINEITDIDWAAGSFLLIKAKAYKQLKGFDEKYFMYFEDVDLCRRAHQLNLSVKYFPQINAIHLAQHQNRKILSKHSWFYLKSYLRYFLK